MFLFGFIRIVYIKKGVISLSIEISNSNGAIIVSTLAISTIVGVAVSECYGVVGMSSKNKIKDGVAELLKRDNYSKGIIIETTDNDISIRIHIIVMYGVKVSEVAQSIQERVKYSIEQMLELNVKDVDIRVDDVIMEKGTK